MGSRSPYGDRQRNVLRLLVEHGPLSAKAIRELLAPSISEEGLRRVLRSLISRDMVQKRFDRHFNGSGVFYQIAQTDDGLRSTGQFLKLPVERLKQPHFRNRELIHSQLCARWSRFVRANYPEAKIIRDFEFDKSDLAKRILISNDPTDDVSPDLLVLIPRASGQSALKISIELERSLKTKARLLAKLKKYSMRSYIDGVLYVVEQNTVSDSIAKLYRASVLSHAQRIAHYGHFFFMFTLTGQSPSSKEQKLIGCNGDALSLTDWIDTLCASESNFRRNRHFELRSISPAKNAAAF